MRCLIRRQVKALKTVERGLLHIFGVLLVFQVLLVKLNLKKIENLIHWQTYFPTFQIFSKISGFVTFRCHCLYLLLKMFPSEWKTSTFCLILCNAKASSTTSHLMKDCSSNQVQQLVLCDLSGLLVVWLVFWVWVVSYCSLQCCLRSSFCCVFTKGFSAPLLLQ